MKSDTVLTNHNNSPYADLYNKAVLYNINLWFSEGVWCDGKRVKSDGIVYFLNIYYVHIHNIIL